MLQARSLRRSVLLVLSLLSACAAAQPGGDAGGPVEIGSASAAQLIARHALAIGDLAEAARAYQRLLQDEPGNTDLIRQAFLTSLLSGGPDTLALARELPNLQAAQLLLADTDAKAGRWNAAAGRYAALDQQGAMQVMRPLLVAWARAGAGQYDSALAGLKPLMDGPNFRALYTLNAAMIADLAGKDDQAGRLYGAASTQFGAANLPLLRQLTSFEARHGERAKAEAQLKAFAGDNPELGLALPGLLRHLDQRSVHRAADGLAEVYTAFAAALRGQANSEQSAVLLRLALNLSPDLTSARLLAADISLAAKRPEEAVALLQPVGADDPLLALVELRRAAIAERMGRPQEALDQLAALAKAVPDRPEPWVMRADILRGQQRYGAAVEAYTKAIELVGTPIRANWALFYNRAIALDRDHKWPGAEADLERALKLYPDQPYVLNYLGYSLAEQGRDLKRARRMIEKALAQKPDDGAITDSLGWVLLREGDTAGGLKQLERAAELEPNDPTVNMHLGDAYWAVGRKLDAQFQWRRAMTLNPEPADQAKLEAKIAEGEKALSAPAQARNDAPKTGAAPGNPPAKTLR